MMLIEWFTARLAEIWTCQRDGRTRLVRPFACVDEVLTTDCRYDRHRDSLTRS